MLIIWGYYNNTNYPLNCFYSLYEFIFCFTPTLGVLMLDKIKNKLNFG